MAVAGIDEMPFQAQKTHRHDFESFLIGCLIGCGAGCAKVIAAQTTSVLRSECRRAAEGEVLEALEVAKAGERQEACAGKRQWGDVGSYCSRRRM